MDSRQKRSELTRNALMEAAEKLIAERGLKNVAIRDIVQAAGQKNESALQYHFGSLQGLIEAIQNVRDEEIQTERQKLMVELLEETSAPDLRQICKLMVAPIFNLVRAKPEYRRYLLAFGHEIVNAERPLALAGRHGGGGASGRRLGEMLRETMSHLDNGAYQRRMETALRTCSAAMVNNARPRNAFKGPRGDLFLESLLDSLVGMLSAPESDESRRLADALRK